VSEVVSQLAFESRHLPGVVVGIDEVGRGAWAGPLVVGAVAITSLSPAPEGLADSKKLTAKKREGLVEAIEGWASASGLGWVSAAEIDAWGLRAALAVAANRAVHALGLTPTFALVDGTFNVLEAPAADGADAWRDELRYASLEHECIVRGDSASAVIAAASVVAKVARDAHMRDLSRSFPSYGWDGNKGYGTAGHANAIMSDGRTPEHRASWAIPGA
jgi:ribonuclease HII